MRILTRLKGLFQKVPAVQTSVSDAVADNKSITEAPQTETVDSNESNPQAEDKEDPYNEFFPLYILHNSKDYVWEEVPYKHVILANPQELIGRVNGNNLMALWQGTGHSEWEAILALIFIQSIKKAEKKNLEEVDISVLFNHNLKASNNRQMSAEQVRKHISRSFKVEKETSDLVRVSFIA